MLSAIRRLILYRLVGGRLFIVLALARALGGLVRRQRARATETRRMTPRRPNVS